MGFTALRSVIGALVILVATWLAAVGCSGLKDVPPPAVYQAGSLQPYADVPEHLQSNRFQVLYVTDRLPIEVNGRLSYGFGRSWAPQFGLSDVTLGDMLTWPDVVAATQDPRRAKDLQPSVGNTRELFKFPRFPLPLVKTEQGIAYEPESLERRDQGIALFQQVMSQQLALTPRKEAFVFIHGFNYDFERSVAVTGQLWHFLGREGVPIAYSWPAGRGGVSGYFYDRESSEFTVYHLRNFLQVLAANPDLEHISLIAHSRGTEIMLDALRELKLMLGEENLAQLKIRNMVLAAPDMDVDVAAQRWITARMATMAETVTIYISPEDMILGFAEWVFGDKRVGKVARNEVPQRLKDLLTVVPNVQFINAEVAGSIIHGYFYENPEVLSDLILLLRYNKPPGAEHGRPLIPLENRFWKIPEGYPYLIDTKT